jgi:hypothetical protein
MESWLDSLKSLLELKNAAKLSLPGIACAFFLLLILWPPKPINLIPIVSSSSLAPSIYPPAFRSRWGELIAPFDHFARDVFMPQLQDPACFVDEYFLRPLPGVTGILFRESKEAAQRRQYALEVQDENLQRCIAAEERLVGAEKSTLEGLQRDLAVFEAEHAKETALLGSYANSVSPMYASPSMRWQGSQRKLEAVRDEIAFEEQNTRTREWEISELKRWKSVVSDRLADPGRLRPELGFDDYLSALSKHVLALFFSHSRLAW